MNRIYQAIPGISIVLNAILLATIALGPIAHAQPPDFTINATPNNLCVNPGIQAKTVVNIQSIGGFVGTVYLTGNLALPTTNGPTLSTIPTSEDVDHGQTVHFTLTMDTSTATPTKDYFVYITALAGSTVHQAFIELAVEQGCSVGGVALPALVQPTTQSYLTAALVAGTIIAITAALVVLQRRKDTKNIS